MELKCFCKKLLVSSGLLRLIYKVKGPSIVILRYHSVQDDPAEHESTIGSSIVHSTKEFREQMRLVSRYYTPISMDELLDHLENGVVLPPYPVVITFDDGYKDNLEIAGPILDEFNIPATFYIVVDAIAKQGNFSPWFMRVRRAFSITKASLWVDRDGKQYSLSDMAQRMAARRAAMAYCGTSTGETQRSRVQEVEQSLSVPYYEAGKDMMLSEDEIKALKEAGHIIGSHTVSHPNMTYIEEKDASYELTYSSAELEKIAGEPVKHFAYPNPILEPNWNEKTRELLKQHGYKTAVTCDGGCVRYGDDPLSLKRVYIPERAEDLRWYIENTLNGFRI